MNTKKPIASALGVLAAGFAVAAFGWGGESNGDAAAAATSKSSGNRGLPQGSEPVNLDPADFTTKIDNRYWPMRPGNRWVYREGDPEGTGSTSSSRSPTRRRRSPTGSRRA